MEMDTDSGYMALSARTLDEVIKPHMVDDFYENYGKWFPRPYCTVHATDFKRTRLARQPWRMKECCKKVYAYDSRTPGLFKEEFEGDGMVALNSKTYFCWSDDDGTSKYSSKGLAKTTNSLTKDCFLSVLRSGESKCGINRGFIRRSNDTFTYSQLKTGLTYFYAKRKVAPDGVSTENIDL